MCGDGVLTLEMLILERYMDERCINFREITRFLRVFGENRQISVRISGNLQINR